MRPFKELYNDSINLIANVFLSHAIEKTEIGILRNRQIEKITSTLDNLKILGEFSQKKHQQAIHNQIKEVIIKINELSKKIFELNGARVLTEEQKKLLDQLEAQKLKLEQERNGLIKHIKKSTKNNEARYLLNNENQALIITGAWLNIKKEIAKEYQGPVNAFIALFVKNNPENSELYKGIPQVIGNLTKDEEEKALAAYHQFIGMVDELKTNKIKLKKTDTVVKDPKYIYAIKNDKSELSRLKMYEYFQQNIKNNLEQFDNKNLNPTATAVQDKRPLKIVTPALAVLPNNQPALNHTIRDSENISDYLDSVVLPAKQNDKQISLSKDDFNKAYTTSMYFLNYTKPEIESQKFKLTPVTANKNNNKNQEVVRYKK